MQPIMTGIKIQVYLPPGFTYSTLPKHLPTVLYSNETLSVCLLINKQVCGLTAVDTDTDSEL